MEPVACGGHITKSTIGVAEMEVLGYSTILQVVALFSSLMALGFTFNASGSKRGLHGVCFNISILMPIVSFSVLFGLLEAGGVSHASDVMVELLQLGLTLASGIATAVHSFKFLG